MLTVFIFFVIEYPMAILCKKIAIKRLHNLSRGKLILTYDDGPSINLEKRLIELLQQNNAKATFFLNAETALNHPELHDQLIDGKQEVACHTFKHHHAWKTAPWVMINDIKRAFTILNGWLTPNSHKIFRPPYGKITTSTWFFLMLRKIKVAFWTIDSRDSLETLPTIHTILETVFKNRGGVILMHSFDRSQQQDKERENFVFELTRELLKFAVNNNLQVCSFSEITHQGKR